MGRGAGAMATVVTLSDGLAVLGQSLLAANGQILLAAHTRADPAAPAVSGEVKA